MSAAPESSGGRRVCLYNVHSGSANSSLVEKLRRQVIASGYPFEMAKLEQGRDGASLVRELVDGGAAEIIACGGDGTIMAAVNGIMSARSRAVLGVVPTGTANLVAGALALPSSEEDAISVALAGDIKAVDLGFCDGHYFALGLGVGAAERFVSEVESSQKAKLGPVAYLWSLAKQIGAPRVRVRVHVDGTLLKEKAAAVMVLNAGHIGSSIRPMPQVAMDDGLLDIVVLRRFGPIDAFRMGWRSLLGRLEEDPAVSTYQGRELTLETIPRQCVQLDGDEVDCAVPLVVRIMPKALSVRVPVKTVAE
jgi:diacylglycerol kinase (ATP)